MRVTARLHSTRNHHLISFSRPNKQKYWDNYLGVRNGIRSPLHTWRSNEDSSAAGGAIRDFLAAPDSAAQNGQISVGNTSAMVALGTAVGVVGIYKPENTVFHGHLAVICGNRNTRSAPKFRSPLVCDFPSHIERGNQYFFFCNWNRTPKTELT